ncbi:MAG: type II toxin-antitoxin system RelE/ParE family toxin [Terracidiphilus sp.]
MATWTIEVSALADRQLDKLDSPIARRIEKFLHERVAKLEDPRSIGEALHGSRLGEFWKYRVGDWRIICEIQDKKLIILALQIGHRREVYSR